jgi:hypothetical protein
VNLSAANFSWTLHGKQTSPAHGGNDFWRKRALSLGSIPMLTDHIGDVLDAS